MQCLVAGDPRVGMGCGMAFLFVFRHAGPSCVRAERGDAGYAR